MPELLEVEQYRGLAARTTGAVIVAVAAPDELFVRDATPADVRSALTGRRLLAWRRIGKLLLADLDDGGVLGIRFGMTGLLELDGARVIGELQYSTSRHEPLWVRFGLELDDGRRLDVVDPRRLGGVELAPRIDRLGPDAATLTAAELRQALHGSEAPLKARLMDQSRVAGLGNLLTDEALWRAGLDPARPAGSLGAAELRRLHTHVRRTVDELARRGGSHLGDLQPARFPGATCPRDGAPLERRTIGGRTTYSCPSHQR